MSTLFSFLFDIKNFFFMSNVLNVIVSSLYASLVFEDISNFVVENVIDNVISECE